MKYTLDSWLLNKMDGWMDRGTARDLSTRSKKRWMGMCKEGRNRGKVIGGTTRRYL